APAQLADNPVTADLPRARSQELFRLRGRCGVAFPGQFAINERGELAANLVGEGGVLVHVLLHGGPLAPAEAGDELLRQPVHAGAVILRGHVRGSPGCRPADAGRGTCRADRQPNREGRSRLSPGRAPQASCRSLRPLTWLSGCREFSLSCGTFLPALAGASG